MRKKKKHTHKLFLTIFVVVFLQKEEITLLQISNEKLNGVGLESLSYTELTSLESKLTEGLRIVDEQTDKAHLELLHLQSVECDVMGSDWVNQKGKDDMAYQSLLAKRRRELRNKARELRLSPPKETQQHYSYYPETLMSDIDSLKMEKKRLRLLNQYENDWSRARRYGLLRTLCVKLSDFACYEEFRRYEDKPTCKDMIVAGSWFEMESRWNRFEPFVKKKKKKKKKGSWFEMESFCYLENFVFYVSLFQFSILIDTYCGY
ncbi:uncharacterized protein LOC108852650 isoform X3 [Raphanus sativus]|uniref:Uncharacterized protein LOC108852650 isoform X3 n=1 Tax=Raphanus sativus TaxID=3726 RepID=A0A9W3DGC2_RAPSA|nr:uncharacterized protein LOC108852650 isoform X3 [Raphanus sativus]